MCFDFKEAGCVSLIYSLSFQLYLIVDQAFVKQNYVFKGKIYESKKSFESRELMNNKITE